MNTKQALKTLIPVVVVLTMLNNLEHASVVYYDISQKHFTTDWLNWIQPILVNLVIDLAVLSWVLRGNHIAAAWYALAIFVINLLYYDALGLITEQTATRIAQFTYSAMFTATIYIFSKIYFDESEKEKTISAYQHEKWEAQKIARELKEQSELLQGENKNLLEYKEGLQCRKCGYQATNINTYDLHMRKEHWTQPPPRKPKSKPVKK